MANFAILTSAQDTLSKGLRLMAVIVGYLLKESLGKRIVKHAKLFRDQKRNIILQKHVTLNGAVLNVTIDTLPHHLAIISSRDGKIVSHHSIETDHRDLDSFISDNLMPENTSVLTPQEILRILMKLV